MGLYANRHGTLKPDLKGAGITRREALALAAFGLTAAPGSVLAGDPAGQLTWGIHVSLAPDLVRPGRNSGGRHALHGALRAA